MTSAAATPVHQRTTASAPACALTGQVTLELGSEIPCLHLVAVVVTRREPDWVSLRSESVTACSAVGGGHLAAAKQDTQHVEFREFMIGCQSRMLRLAELLTGDRGHAEDLAQHGFAKAYAAWGRLRRGDPEAYVRRCIANANTDRWRRGTWRERSSDRIPEERVGADHAGALAQRAVVLDALSKLDQRERAVVALRYFLDLSEAQIAAELGIPAGTVKSTAARALAKLRRDAELREEASR